ncbi:hypothetical protein OOK27_22340 [Streptomyces canus]|uniref:hypothetical protein n=1 Tax=Streptomyces canus TaxID=58343 RepID=UPI00224ECCA2|nr:hypothetical protein [Streptomyces canus]MCX5256838.1 hypothetical protein [Streptomyces canus]
MADPVVVLEFGNEVPRRSFDGLLPPEVLERRVRIDPLGNPGLCANVEDIDAQAEYWVHRLDALPEPPRTVLAYCSGARLAASVAFRMNDARLVLFDPVSLTADTVQEVFVASVDTIAGGVPQDGVPFIADMPPDRALVTARSYIRKSALVAASDVPEDILNALIEKQSTWLAFTLAASSPKPWEKCPDHVFLSAGMSWEEHPGTDVKRFDISAVDLFHTNQVMHTLAPLLT